MDALPKVTKVVRDMFDDMVQSGQEQTPGPSEEPLPVSPRKDAEFEDLGSCPPVNRALPEKVNIIASNKKNIMKLKISRT